MSKIPSIVYNATLRIYKPRDKDSVVASEKKASNWHIIEKDFTHVRLMSSLSVREFLQKQSDYRQKIVSYNTSSQELSKAADALTNPIFLEEKNIDVTNPGAFSKIEAKAGAKVTQYDLGITQLALSQVNEGKSFLKSEYRRLLPGIYTLGIKADGAYNKQETQATIYVAENDNMDRVIQKFANVINAGNTMVTAQVKEQGDEVSLCLKAKETGTDNSFTVRDINGNAGEELGIKHIKQPARSARYTVNGVKKESFNNKVLLDDGNVVLIADAEIAAEKVSVTRDYAKSAATVHVIVEQYNNLQDILSDSDNLSDKGERLLSGITALVGEIKKEEFESIGVSLNKSSKHMELDEARLFKAIANNPEKVKQLFSEKPGFGEISKSLAETVRENPLSSFVKTPNMLDSIDYGWRWRSARDIGMISLGSFAAFNQGMFFDMFI